MTTPLSQQDVELLLKNPTEDSRVSLASKLAATLEQPSLSADERQLADEILRLMAHDAAIRVREALAANLRTSPFLPRDVALALAQDVDAVAVPVLESSEVLTDEDLLRIVREAGEAKQTAMARRPVVGPDLADALVDVGSEKVASTLVGNVGAQLRTDTLGTLAERYADSEGVMSALVSRQALPVTIAERLVARMSDQLRSYFASRGDLNEQVASELLLRTQERATASLSDRLDVDTVEKLVAQLADNQRLTPSLILRALAMGDLLFFEAATARLAGIPLRNARILIHDGGELGLKSLYEKAGLPGPLFSPFRVAVRVVASADLRDRDYDRETFSRTMLERILSDCDDLGEEDADWLLRRLYDLAPPWMKDPT